MYVFSSEYLASFQGRKEGDGVGGTGLASIVNAQSWLRTAPVEDMRGEVMHFWVGANHITIKLIDDFITLCSISIA